MKRPNASKSVRCAIYTRKSTEEGLEQAFNSLDAQREACAAYIESQKHEGWKIVRVAYDEGGFSGGTMERPALARLLADVDAGLIDTVVVYKIDRLTRALADFAKIVERFDKRSVTFVSVTQSFNTTTSMGRLTLNVLLSFAQFEREVTAERIRDKIAASRAKGIFMGGNPPLGYDPRKRKLVINEAEAKTVRMIFERYLAVQSVGRLAAELNARGVTTKAWVSATGRQMGGGSWYVGPLFHVLRNRVYVGDAVHKGKIYKGEHAPLLDRAVYDRVQALLERNRIGYERKIATESPGLLTGLIFDDRGNAMTPQRSGKKGGTSNVYYVSQALLQHRHAQAGSLPRVAAKTLEALVTHKLESIVAQETANLAHELISREVLRNSIRRVHVEKDRVVIEFMASVFGEPGSAAALKMLKNAIGSMNENEQIEPQQDAIVWSGNVRLQTRGGTRRLESRKVESWTSQKSRPNKALIAAIVAAHRWMGDVIAGSTQSMEDLVRQNEIDRKQTRLILRLALLAPDIQRAILTGGQASFVTLRSLFAASIPASWQEQRRILARASGP
jgi:site-specific DNA recombinase